MRRVTMGTKSFFNACNRHDIVAELHEGGKKTAVFGSGEPDVEAHLLPSETECELRGKTLKGQLFLSVLVGGGG